MTWLELEDLLATIWGYLMRGLALIGFIAVVAIGSYLYHSDQPVKVARAGRCINSACDQPCTPRFQRHAGDCNGTR